MNKLVGEIIKNSKIKIEEISPINGDNKRRIIKIK